MFHLNFNFDTCKNDNLIVLDNHWLDEKFLDRERKWSFRCMLNLLIERKAFLTWYRTYMDETLWWVLIAFLLLDERLVMRSLSCWSNVWSLESMIDHSSMSHNSSQWFIHVGATSSIILKFCSWANQSWLILRSSRWMTCHSHVSPSTLLPIIIKCTILSIFPRYCQWDDRLKLENDKPQKWWVIYSSR